MRCRHGDTQLCAASAHDGRGYCQDRCVAEQRLCAEKFHISGIFTEQVHLSWIENQVKPGYVVQFIICLSDGREIGSVYFRDIDREEGTAEYGIFIGEEDALGCGYGTEAAKLALEYAFVELRLKKVFLRFLADNIGAQRSYEHAGFRLTDMREKVMTQQGEREVCFMEIDYMTWRADNSPKIK